MFYLSMLVEHGGTFSSVRIPASDGLSLHACYIPLSSMSAVSVLCHLSINYKVQTTTLIQFKTCGFILKDIQLFIAHVHIYKGYVLQAIVCIYPDYHVKDWQSVVACFLQLVYRYFSAPEFELSISLMLSIFRISSSSTLSCGSVCTLC